MTILETRVQKVATANGLKNFKSTIPFAFKCELSGKACDVIVENNIPFMPYGHAIVTEAMAELNLMYDESSNAFTK